MIQRRAESSPFAVRGLSVAYGDALVLENVSFEAEPGRRIAIVGPNGAGKTTLLEAALGLVPKLAGEVRFFGRPLADARDRIAYVPQREAVDWDFPITAREVAGMGLFERGRGPMRRWIGAASPRCEQRALAALDEVGMRAFADRPIGQLSGGQQQRVFLARALARDAELILLDEPFAGVDAATEELLFDHFARLAADGRTVVSVHHDLAGARERFDDALLVRRTLIAAGPVEHALSDANLARAYGERHSALLATP